MADATSQIAYFADRARQLYSLPSVALEVLELTSRPGVDLRAIRKCVERDPALTCKVLRVVNSSLFGLSREVCDLNQALALLGLKPLKMLVLGFSLAQAIPGSCIGSVMSRYWRHSLTQAIAAREISEVVLHKPGDEAFLAGLLEDIGILVLLQELGEPYSKLLERILERRGDVVGTQLSTLGFDHTALSARLLEHWSLPTFLVAAVQANCRGQDDGYESPSSGLAGVLHVSRLLADLLVDGRSDAIPLIEASTIDQHRLDSQHLKLLTASLQEKVGQLADALAVELPEATPYEQVLSRAHDELSQTAAEAAIELLSARKSTQEDDAEIILRQMNALRTAVEQVIRGNEVNTDERSVPDCDRQVPSQSGTVAVIPGELQQALRGALLECRARQSSLSMILIEISSADDMLATWGPVEADMMLKTLYRVCATIDSRIRCCVRTQETRFALLIPHCDRRQAVELGRQVLRTMREALKVHSAASCSLRVSVGAATVHAPAKNFWPDELVQRAERCLRAAQLAGGNTLKSIGVS